MPRKLDSDVQIGKRLKLRDLQLFFTVVQAGSMAKAAAALGITQPAVSEAIAGLEATLGVKLFDRSHLGVEPTVYGSALHKRGLAAFDELKQGIRDIDSLSDPASGELRIGCTEGTPAILAPILEAFLQKNPRVTVHVDTVDNRSLQLPSLRNRECDLVMGHFSKPLMASPLADDLNVETLFDDQMVITAGRGTRWGRRRKVDLADLVNEAWILSVPTSWNFRIISEAFRARGLEMPKIRIVSFSAHLRADMVASGAYIATFPGSVANHLSKRFPIEVLRVDLPKRPWPMAIVTLRNRTLSAVANRFAEHLRASTKQN